MSTSTSLASPAHLIAEIPGILGFHPANSVVFMLLKREDSNTFSLGPVLRMDVGDTESLPEITSCINSFHPDVVFAVVSAELPNHNFIGEMVHVGIKNLDVVWHVRGISEDEPYTALWTARSAHDYDVDMLAGLVAPIHAAVSTRESLAHGDLIALSRDEAFEALALVPAREQDGDALVEQARALLEHVGPFSDLILPLREDLAAGHRTEAQARVVAAMIAGAGVRDLALGELLLHPDLAKDLLADLAQQLADTELRAGALAMLACVLMAGGHQARASIVIKAAATASRDHRLTQLLVEASVVGALDVLVPALNEGILLGRLKANIPEPVR